MAHKDGKQEMAHKDSKQEVAQDIGDKRCKTRDARQEMEDK